MIKDLKKVFSFTSKVDFIFPIILLFLSLILSITIPLILVYFVDGKSEKIIILFLAFLLDIIFMLLALYLLNKKSEIIFYNIRKKLYEHVLKMPINFFKNINETVLVNNFFTIFFKNEIYNFCIMLFSLSFMYLINVYLFLVFLFFMILYFVLFVKIKQIKLKEESNIEAYFKEVIFALPIIKQYEMEKETKENFSLLCEDSSKENIFYLFLKNNLHKIITIFSFVIILLLGFFLLSKGDISLGFLLAFLLYYSMFMYSFKDFSFLNLKQINTILDVFSKDIENAGDKKISIKGNIEFKHIFGDEFIKIKEGERIVIVSSNNKKSYIKDLINKFYLPIKGDVLIDGISIKELNAPFLRKNIALSLDPPILVGSTIKEFLNYNVLRDKEKMELLGVHDTILNFPAGYNCKIEDVINYNDKCLLSLSRAVLSNSKILLLDGLDTLDSQTKKKFISALNKLSKNKTVIVFTNDFSLFKDYRIIDLK